MRVHNINYVLFITTSIIPQLNQYHVDKLLLNDTQKGLIKLVKHRQF